MKTSAICLACFARMELERDESGLTSIRLTDEILTKCKVKQARERQAQSESGFCKELEISAQKFVEAAASTFLDSQENQNVN